MLDPDTDPFRPPKVSTLVGCLHCRQVYESFLIEWRETSAAAGGIDGFWCCPVDGCGGKGFGFDILPVDRDWTDEDGERMWVDDEEEDYPDALEDDPPSDKPHTTGGSEEIPY